MRVAKRTALQNILRALQRVNPWRSWVTMAGQLTAIQRATPSNILHVVPLVRAPQPHSPSRAADAAAAGALLDQVEPALGQVLRLVELHGREARVARVRLRTWVVRMCVYMQM